MSGPPSFRKTEDRKSSRKVSWDQVSFFPFCLEKNPDRRLSRKNLCNDDDPHMRRKNPAYVNVLLILSIITNKGEKNDQVAK